MIKQPFELSLFLPDGISEGMKIIQKSNWNGRGLSIPRNLFAKHKNRAELQRPGVYILVGDMEFEPKIYVGEGDPLFSRLLSHDNNKDFWDLLIAFTSSDQNLNKASIQYLEARLIQIARKTKRFKITNGNNPKEPFLSEKDLAISEGFLCELLICLPILGLSFKEGVFEEALQDCFYIKAKTIQASGLNMSEGFKVLKGSQATACETRSISPGLRARRHSLIENGILQKIANDNYVFSEDYHFDSPSTASGVVLGRNSNGRIDWKDLEGRSLKEREVMKEI